VQAKATAERLPMMGEHKPSAMSAAAAPSGPESLEHSSVFTTGSMWILVSRIWT